MKLIVSTFVYSLCLAGLAVAQEASNSSPPAPVRAFIDDEAPGWRNLEKGDFAGVNIAPDNPSVCSGP
jgi:hypothetical protein